MKKFGESGCFSYETPDPIRDVVEAVKRTVPNLAPGWHTASISFKLYPDGRMEWLDEYKVSNFGDTKPAASDGEEVTEAVESLYTDYPRVPFSTIVEQGQVVYAVAVDSSGEVVSAVNLNVALAGEKKWNP